MKGDLLTFVTCKCCGVEHKSTAFSRNVKGNITGICSTCKHKRQVINCLKKKPNLTTQEEERLNDAIAWFKACKETTGYEVHRRLRNYFNKEEL